MIYLDNNATTRMADEALQAMLPYLRTSYANPSSPYRFGRVSSLAVLQAREQVAALLQAHPDEILFTSSGTESNNTALVGALEQITDRTEVVTSGVEHASVLRVMESLAKRGYRVHRVPVDRNGLLNVAELEKSVSSKTALVSMMHINNETGVELPVQAMATIVKESGALFHVDAVQAIGKVPLNVRALGADLVSLSGHKFHGPKGVGALYIRKGCELPSLLKGGTQEYGRRAGTENVPGLVGLGAAAQWVQSNLVASMQKMKLLRDFLETALLEQIRGIEVIGSPSPRVCNTSAVLIHGVESEALLALLDLEDICCSTGSACAAGSNEPSHVLQAMGMSTAEMGAAIRFSVSRFNTVEEIQRVVDQLVPIVDRLRGHLA